MEGVIDKLSRRIPGKMREKLSFNKLIRKNKDITYVDFITQILESREYEKEFAVLDVDIRGEWFLDWEVYEVLKEKVDVEILSTKSI